MKQFSNQIALAALAARLTALNGLGVDPAATAGMAAMFEKAAATGGVPMMSYRGSQVKVADVMDQARGKVPEAVTALNALRMENIDLYLRATLDFSMMFETITLADNEQPVIESTYRNPVNIRFSGEDGGMRGVKAVKAQKQQFFNLREMHSDTVGYQMRDINQGTDVATAAQKTFEISWDLRHRINTELYAMLQGGVINGFDYGAGVYGAFKKTGAKLDRTFVLGPGIQTANLPLTNLILPADLNAIDGYDLSTTKGRSFRFSVIRAVVNYLEGFRGIFPDGDLEATGAILIPSSETTGLANEIQPTGQFYNKVGETVLNSFTKVEYLGRVWTLIGTPALPPGACYPIFNKKVGNYYVKPKLDFEHVDSNVLKNWEERTAVKVMAFATLEPWRLHTMKVIYSNVANAGTMTKNL